MTFPFAYVLELFTENDNESFHEAIVPLVQRIFTEARELFSFLWFVKDCCCFLSELTIYSFERWPGSPSGGVRVVFNPEFYTLSNGGFATISFTPEELIKANEISLKFKDIVHDKLGRLPEVNDDFLFIRANEFPYNNLPGLNEP